MKKSLFFIGVLFVMALNSCQKSEEPVVKSEIVEVNQVLKQERNEAVLKFGNFMKGKSEDIKKIYQDLVVLRLQSFEVGGNGVLKKNSEEEIKEKLFPMLKESKELLLNYGIDDELFKLEFGNSEDPRIIELAMLFFKAEIISDYETKKNKLETNPLPVSYAVSNDVFDCLVYATGVKEVMDFIESKAVSKVVARQLLKKAAAKVAGRALGWVGLAITAYEFGKCMDFYEGIEEIL